MPAALNCAETAQLAGDRFRLWSGLRAGERFGDIWIARVGPGHRRDGRLDSPNGGVASGLANALGRVASTALPDEPVSG